MSHTIKVTVLVTRLDKFPLYLKCILLYAHFYLHDFVPSCSDSLLSLLPPATTPYKAEIISPSDHHISAQTLSQAADGVKFSVAATGVGYSLSSAAESAVPELTRGSDTYQQQVSAPVDDGMENRYVVLGRGNLTNKYITGANFLYCVNLTVTSAMFSFLSSSLNSISSELMVAGF